MGEHSLKFARQPLRAVLAGEVTKTVRVGFERTFVVGNLLLIQDHTGETVATTRVSTVVSTTARAFYHLNGADGYYDHETLAAFLDSLDAYYPDEVVTGDTPVTVIEFRELTEDDRVY